MLLIAECTVVLGVIFTDAPGVTFLVVQGLLVKIPFCADGTFGFFFGSAEVVLVIFSGKDGLVDEG